MHLLLEPGVGDHQAAAVQDVVADKAVDEGLDLLDECWRLPGELGQALGQAVRQLHVAAVQRPQQLGLVIPGDAQGGASLDHAHDQA